MPEISTYLLLQASRWPYRRLRSLRLLRLFLFERGSQDGLFREAGNPFPLPSLFHFLFSFLLQITYDWKRTRFLLFARESKSHSFIFRTIFPNCLPPSIRSVAFCTSSSGWTLSMTGFNLFTETVSSISRYSEWLPIVEPRILSWFQ